jgi:hypothetical protein
MLVRALVDQRTPPGIIGPTLTLIGGELGPFLYFVQVFR